VGQCARRYYGGVSLSAPFHVGGHEPDFDRPGRLSSSRLVLSGELGRVTTGLPLSYSAIPSRGRPGGVVIDGDGTILKRGTSILHSGRSVEGAPDRHGSEVVPHRNGPYTLEFDRSWRHEGTVVALRLGGTITLSQAWNGAVLTGTRRTVTLAPKGRGTLFTFKHDGFPRE
jgi:hypothetical protein